MSIVSEGTKQMCLERTQHHPHKIEYMCCDYCWPDNTGSFLQCHICGQEWPCKTKQQHIQERAIEKELG
jgi:hypothetical protein